MNDPSPNDDPLRPSGKEADIPGQSGPHSCGTGFQPVEDRFHSRCEKGFSHQHYVLLLMAVILLGVSMRLWLILTPGLGHEPDIKLFLKWTRALADPEHGLWGFYDAVSFCNYPPLALLIFWVVGHVAALTDATLANADLVRALLKVPACLADLGIALLLFYEGRRLFGGPRAVAASALYFLNPVSIYDSAYWGQVDAIHSAFLLLALILVNRQRFGWAGAASALALCQKFQSIAFLPLIVLEVFRIGRWRATRSMLVGGLAAAASVFLPFVWSGSSVQVFQRAYVQTIGQYPDVSRNAYNVWYILGVAGAPDSSIPLSIAKAVADGRVSFPDDASWMLLLTWRRISLAAYCLCVAAVLSIYSLRPGVIARFGAAGLLGLAFFLIPTEIHERYSLPVIAVLALWAVTGAWRERIFFLLSAMLLLNLAAVQPAGDVAPQIAGAYTALFIVLLGWLALSRAHHPAEVSDGPVRTARWNASRPVGNRSHTDPSHADPSHAGRSHRDLCPPEPAAAPSKLICWFRRATGMALASAVVAGVWIAALVAGAPPTEVPEQTVYLSSLTPIRTQQGWGKLATDTSVGHGPIYLGNTYYLRGLGTHAPSRLEYAIPEGLHTFETVVGIDKDTRGRGSVKITVQVDGKGVFTSGKITWESGPVTVRIPVEGASTLVLVADPTADGKRSDHVDWAAARFLRSRPQPED